MRIRCLLHKDFAHFWHWLNCLEILFFFSFAPSPLILLIHASHRLRFSLWWGKKPLNVFTCLEDIFFPSTISILRTTEEFMPIKLGCAICGRIKDIARLNPKSTDFMFWGCRSLFIAYIVLAFTRHVFKTYQNAFIVQRFDFDVQLETPFFGQWCLFRLLKSRIVCK